MKKETTKTFRFSREDAELLKREAERMGISESEYIRKLMNEYVLEYVINKKVKP